MTCEKSDLPGCLAGLSIQNEQQVTKLFEQATHYYNQTPISFWFGDDMNAFFGVNSASHFKKLSTKEKIQLHLKLE